MEPSSSAPCVAEQPLQTPWTLWFDRLASGTDYSSTLQRLGTVHTVQGFWRYYCNLARPGQLQPGDNYHLFRGALQPAQETLPGGGCWLYRLQLGRGQQLGDTEVNRLWETLLLTILGESLGEPCVVGAGVSVRQNVVVLTTWCRADDDKEAAGRVGLGLRVSTSSHPVKHSRKSAPFLIFGPLVQPVCRESSEQMPNCNGGAAAPLRPNLRRPRLPRPLRPCSR